HLVEGEQRAGGAAARDQEVAARQAEPACVAGRVLLREPVAREVPHRQRDRAEFAVRGAVDPDRQARAFRIVAVAHDGLLLPPFRQPARVRGPAASGGASIQASWLRPRVSIVDDERHLHRHAIFRNGIARNLDLLLVNPGFLDVLDGLAEALEALCDGILEALRGARADFRDFRNAHPDLLWPCGRAIAPLPGSSRRLVHKDSRRATMTAAASIRSSVPLASTRFENKQ